MNTGYPTWQVGWGLNTGWMTGWIRNEYGLDEEWIQVGWGMNTGWIKN